MGEEHRSAARNCTGELLEKLYKNVGMESEALTGMLAKVKNVKLSEELTDQLGTYCKYSNDIKAELSSVTNDTPKVGAIGRMTAKLGV